MNREQIVFWIVFCATLVLLFTPVSVGGKDGFGLDKIVHASMFAALAVSAFFAFPAYRVHFFLFVIAYAFLSELVQDKYLPRRHFDWYDIASDVVGVAIGILIFSAIRYFRVGHKPVRT